MYPSTEELIDIEIVNGLKELGDDGDNSFFKEIVILYEDQAQGLISEIKQHAETGDAEQMGKSAHTLKGASLNIGARLFADVCKAIELAGKNNEVSSIGAYLEKLDGLNELTLIELKKQF
jgi:HPt (histidine-containing phosphotransfer) domain-containing protein